MEVIRLSGYTEDEKVNISQKYLIPNQSKNNGLKKEEWTIDESINRKLSGIILESQVLET